MVPLYCGIILLSVIKQRYWWHVDYIDLLVWYVLRVKFLFWNPPVPPPLLPQTPSSHPSLLGTPAPVIPPLISRCLPDRYSPGNVWEDDEVACVLVSLSISDEVASRTYFALKFEKTRHRDSQRANYSGNNVSEITVALWTHCLISTFQIVFIQKADTHWYRVHFKFESSFSVISQHR